MTVKYYPFGSGTGTGVDEAKWSDMAQLFRSTGPILGKLNELEVYADSSGMQVKVKSGQGFIEGHFYESSAEQIVAISTAHATLDRIDVLALEVDWVTKVVAVVIVEGTAAGSPVAESMTQTTAKWQIALAEILVDAAASTIASTKITDKRVYSALVGKQRLLIQVSMIKPATTSGADATAQEELTAQRPEIIGMNFPTGADAYAIFGLSMPKKWNKGTITFVPRVIMQGTNTGTYIFELSGVARGEGETIHGAAYGTGQSSTITGGGVDNSIQKGPESSVITIAGTPLDGDKIYFQIFFDDTTGTGSDAIVLEEIEIYWTTEVLTED